MVSRPKHPGDDAEPIGIVLARLQAELDAIGRRVDHNQAVIARSTWPHASADEDYVRAMQDGDLNAQRIAGVAEFLRAIGETLSADWRIDTRAATSQIRLAEQIRSIGSASAEVTAHHAHDSGDVDLF